VPSTSVGGARSRASDRSAISASRCMSELVRDRRRRLTSIEGNNCGRAGLWRPHPLPWNAGDAVGLPARSLVRDATPRGARRKKVGKTCCGFCESVRRPSAQATRDTPDAVCHPTQNGHDHEKHDPYGLRSLRELLLLYDLQDDERRQGEHDNDLYRVKEERSERGRAFLVEDVRSEPADSKDTGVSASRGWVRRPAACGGSETVRSRWRRCFRSRPRSPTAASRL
jgi:hypothetical protein